MQEDYTPACVLIIMEGKRYSMVVKVWQKCGRFIYAMIKPSLHDEGMMFFNKFCVLTLHFKRMSLWLVKENLVETELIFYG